MKIQFDKNDKEQLELIKAMASKNKVVAAEAQESFAELLSPVVSEQYPLEGTSQLLYRNDTYTEGTNPTLALDLLVGKDENYISIWTSGPMPGGAPTNTVQIAPEEFPILPYKLETAISYLKTWASQSRLNVVARVIERLYEEILLKSEDNAWYVALAAIVGSTNPDSTNLGNLRATATPGTFTLDDLNKLFTAFRRTNPSWAGGSTPGRGSFPTDLIMSPEIFEKIRSFAYQPVNTVGGNFTAITSNTQNSAAAVVTLSDADRAKLFGGAGTPNFFGTNITVIDEFGPTQRYNTMFASLVGSTAVPLLTGGTRTFSNATSDIILAIDATKDFAWRLLATDADNGNVLTLEADDQFIKRSEKIGSYGSVKEARVVTETRGLLGLIV